MKESKRLILDLFKSEKDSYISGEDISGRRDLRQVVLTIAGEYSSVYSRIDSRSINVSRSLRILKGSGLVLKNEEGHYILSDPLFALWIRKKVLKLIR